jgi:hypothetical protein
LEIFEPVKVDGKTNPYTFAGVDPGKGGVPSRFDYGLLKPCISISHNFFFRSDEIEESPGQSTELGSTVLKILS